MSAPPSAWALERAVSIAQSLIASLQSEGVDTDEGELRVILQEQQADVPALLIRLLRAADEADADVDQLTARMDTLSMRKQRRARAKQTYRDAAQQIIEALPQLFPARKFRCPEFTASLVMSQPKGIVTDEKLLPDKYWRTSRAIDQAAVNAMIRAGGSEPGVTKTNAAPVLTVRSK